MYQFFNFTKLHKQFFLYEYKMTRAIVKVTQKLREQFIKNRDLPVCINCVFFEKQHKTGLCKKFGEKNIITGEIKYMNVLSSRNDLNSCGEKGTYYVEK